MSRTVVSLLLLCLGAGPAFAQAAPMSAGPPGTPITPAQIGHWIFPAGLSREEAVSDAGLQGYGAAHALHEDRYGDWIGQSHRGAFIVFPDGRVFPF
ncbi:hypothetical protein [Acidisoma sp. 7E03]